MENLKKAVGDAGMFLSRAVQVSQLQAIILYALIETLRVIPAGKMTMFVLLEKDIPKFFNKLGHIHEKI